MKHLLLLLFTFNLLFAKEYAVQVLAVKNPTSITPYFKRVASKMESDTIKMQVIEEQNKKSGTALQKVLFKSFKDKKSAQEFCKVARKTLFDDAFVRALPSNILKVKSAIATNRSQTKKIVKKEHVKRVVKKYVSAREQRKVRRMSEIAQAIAFYKNSSCLKFSCKSGF